jgi:malonyl-CoA O-methyltransferase
MMSEQNNPIDKQQARLAFSRAAPHYDEVAVLQKEIGLRMIERLELVKMTPQSILDIGAGTGLTTAELGKYYRKANIVALDFALPMLQLARKRGSWLHRPRCVCGDLDKLPFANRSFDLIYSNAALQWSNDLEHSFSGFLRVLRPGGLLMFSTFGPDTLKELRAAWGAVDTNSHVSRFPDMHDVGDALVRSRFAEPVMDVDRITLTYREVEGLMRDLKILGAHNVTAHRPRGLTGKGRMAAMRAAYEQFRVDGLLPASYEVVYGHAWAPERVEKAGSVGIPVNEIGRL